MEHIVSSSLLVRRSWFTRWRSNEPNGGRTSFVTAMNSWSDVAIS
jgi:hypothetical protein